jgi:hypothetical protein
MSILALEFHGYMRLRWFQDIKENIFIDYEKTLKALESWRL